MGYMICPSPCNADTVCICLHLKHILYITVLYYNLRHNCIIFNFSITSSIPPPDIINLNPFDVQNEVICIFALSYIPYQDLSLQEGGIKLPPKIFTL